jgi:hypothetical protein
VDPHLRLAGRLNFCRGPHCNLGRLHARASRSSEEAPASTSILLFARGAQILWARWTAAKKDDGPFSTRHALLKRMMDINSALRVPGNGPFADLWQGGRRERGGP